MNQVMKSSCTQYTPITLLSAVGRSGVRCHQNGRETGELSRVYNETILSTFNLLPSPPPREL